MQVLLLLMVGGCLHDVESVLDLLDGLLFERLLVIALHVRRAGPTGVRRVVILGSHRAERITVLVGHRRVLACDASLALVVVHVQHLALLVDLLEVVVLLRRELK